MAFIVYSFELKEREFKTLMKNNTYKPVSFCPVCKTPNSRVGAHLFFHHNWTREQARAFYRNHIIFVHSLASRPEKEAASRTIDEWITEGY